MDNVEINFDAMKKKVFMALPLYLISKSSYIFEKCWIVAFGKSIQSFGTKVGTKTSSLDRKKDLNKGRK